MQEFLPAPMAGSAGETSATAYRQDWWLLRSPLMPVVGSLPLPPLGVEFTCFIWIRLHGRVPLRGPGHDFKRMSIFDSILIAPLSGMFRFHKSKSAISSK